MEIHILPLNVALLSALGMVSATGSVAQMGSSSRGSITINLVIPVRLSGVGIERPKGGNGGSETCMTTNDPHLTYNLSLVAGGGNSGRDAAKFQLEWIDQGALPGRAQLQIGSNVKGLPAAGPCPNGHARTWKVYVKSDPRAIANGLDLPILIVGVD